MTIDEANRPEQARAAELEVPGVPLPDLGADWSLRPVEVTSDEDGGSDVALVHEWMNAEHVAPHWLQAWPLEQWRDELDKQLGGNHSLPCLVSRDGRHVAYVELYRVLRDRLAPHYEYHPRDLGVHIAIGEPQATGRGLGSSLLRAIAEGLLAADQDCHRVVAEPSVHNGASVGAFAKAGFVRVGEVTFPEKTAALMFFARR